MYVARRLIVLPLAPPVGQFKVGGVNRAVMNFSYFPP